jgi:hypothetical protein
LARFFPYKKFSNYDLRSDVKIDAFRSVLRTDIRRDRDAVIAWRIAFSQTARLQWARITLNPFQLKAADRDGLDHPHG